jgi:PEP-CTERM motif
VSYAIRLPANRVNVLNPEVMDNTTTNIVSGTFTFDPSLPKTLSADLVVTGNSQPGTYTVVDTNGADFIDVDSVTGFGIRLVFVDPLGNAPDTVLDVVYLQTVGAVDATQGVAVPVATPEPTSLALLGGALGLFLLRSRAKLRCRQA